MGHLATAGDVSDEGGKASVVLAAAIGYPGSSVAFAQLLTGMERAGLIRRDIRGKRTYRIAPAGVTARGGLAARAAARSAWSGAGGRRDGGKRSADPAAASTPIPDRAAASPAASTAASASKGRGNRRGADPAPDAGLAALAGVAGLDYDELARRLLIQVVQQLTNPAGPPPVPQGQTAAGQTAAGQAVGGPGAAGQQTVVGLEQKLASAASRQRKLTAENARLREQLRDAQQSLAEAQERASAEAERFGTAELRLLERLLAPLREPDGQEEAGAG